MLAAREAAALYQTDFVRNARAVGALWAGCSLCFGILEVVVLIQPAWVQTAPLTYQLPISGALSDPSMSAVGSFGLYQVCTDQDGVLQCEGSLVTLTPIPSFKAAAVFVLMALVLVMGSVASLGLFWVCSAGTVYKVCAWQQLSAATCQALGCLVFPDGWGAPEVRALCGPQARSYTLGTCSIHWAFTLALLGIADALVLATLAFVLGNRQDALLPAGYTPPREGRGAKRFFFLKNCLFSRNTNSVQRLPKKLVAAKSESSSIYGRRLRFWCLLFGRDTKIFCSCD